MSKVYLLPLACFVLFQYTFICVYIAAVIQGHVVPDLPYISDAATYSPESCIFGQLINIGCVLLGLTIYTRYRQINHIMEVDVSLRNVAQKLNDRSMWIGMVSCLGISIVANFQETNVRIMHYVGAFCAFGMGTVYFWIQSILSYYLQPYPYTASMQKSHIRLGLAVLCTIFFIVVAVCGIISHILFEGSNPRKWYPSDGGWRYHVASSIAEWGVATVFCFYILTFTEEFRNIHFDHPKLTLLEHTEILLNDAQPISETEPIQVVI